MAPQARPEPHMHRCRESASGVACAATQIDGRRVNIDYGRPADKSKVCENRAKTFSDFPSEPSVTLFLDYSQPRDASGGGGSGRGSFDGDWGGRGHGALATWVGGGVAALIGVGVAVVGDVVATVVAGGDVVHPGEALRRAASLHSRRHATSATAASWLHRMITDKGGSAPLSFAGTPSLNHRAWQYLPMSVEKTGVISMQHPKASHRPSGRSGRFRSSGHIPEPPDLPEAAGFYAMKAY
ncbi:hypothetical protein DFH07DRAFT_963544 [Mycena maculata]|uniref:Uncharacterized protein n=1 Tax=Mycena maculata TaxID=230809 RepID=A0AAD7IN04_9AGAR|nr:hypothetical protein DFH07DRAFT_963544 [Mycena maculata]